MSEKPTEKIEEEEWSTRKTVCVIGGFVLAVIGVCWWMERNTVRYYPSKNVDMKTQVASEEYKETSK